MRAVVVLAIAVGCAGALGLAGEASRVVFVRDNEIYTGSEDGSRICQLTSDGKPKHMPKWSPRGTEIAYLTSGDMSANPKSMAKIEVISVSGQHMGTAPVLVTMTDGTEVAGMRWVDSIGWNDPRNIFAEGSASPYSGQYRIMDARTGRAVNGYIVSQSATCSSKGQVAYWTAVFSPSMAMRLEINGKEVGFEFPDVNSLPSISVPLVWTPDCEYVAFVDPRPPAALVLIGAEQGERKVQLPGCGFEAGELTLIKEGLLITGATKAMIYDFRENTVSEAPKVLLQRVEQQRTERERLVLELGGESPDWFTDPPTPLPAN